MDEGLYTDIVNMKLRISELERAVLTLKNALSERSEIITLLRNDTAELRLEVDKLKESIKD